MHPSVAPVVKLLEANFELIAAERASVAGNEELKRDIFPVTNLDKVWVGLNFVENHGPLRAEKCCLAPRTCDAVRRQGVLRTEPSNTSCSCVDDKIFEKVMWTVVEPEARFAAHSEETWGINVQICMHGCEQAELRVNSSVVRKSGAGPWRGRTATDMRLRTTAGSRARSCRSPSHALTSAAHLNTPAETSRE